MKNSAIPELPLSEHFLSQNFQHADAILGSSLQYNNTQQQRSASYKPSAGSIYGTNVIQHGNTRRKPSFKFDSNILNRVQQTIGIEKTEDTVSANSVKQSPSFKKGLHGRLDNQPVNHQVSLDSGIYLASEIDEHGFSPLVRS